MAKFILDNPELAPLVRALDKEVGGKNRHNLRLLAKTASLGLHGYRIVLAMKPLVDAVWASMAKRDDPNRFAVERMIKDMDGFLCSWVEVGKGRKPRGVKRKVT